MKAIIFDLDGVLVFTDKYHYQAWKKLADSLHLDFDEIKNHRLRGVGRMESLDIVLEDSEKIYTNEEKIQFAQQKNQTYREFLEQMTEEDVSEEVRTTLTELKKRGYHLAIGSSSKNAGFILDKTGLRGYFDAVSDGNNITRSKPDPEVFLTAAEYLNAEPDECYVMEDATAGIDGAKSAGMRTIGIGEAAYSANTDFPVSRFQEILELLK